MVPHVLIFLWTLLDFSTCEFPKNEIRQCVVVKNEDQCGMERKNVSLLLAKQGDRCTNDTKYDSTNEEICRKTFKVTYLRPQLYTLTILDLFISSLEECCGNCTGFKIINTIPRLSQISRKILDESDVIFPLLASRTVSRLYGCYYIPVLQVPTCYYITLRATKNKKMLALILGILDTWPLIVVCLLLAFISGFIIWIMEKKGTPEEFPKAFLEGIWEGFWWSFVSMTTVGYGDKTPRSICGRTFAIFWILIGITMFAILTGALTNEITSIQTEPDQDMLDKRVGTLKHKFHESTMVAQHGGILEAIEFDDTTVAVHQLIEKLQRKEIHGILISRVTYYFFHRRVSTYEKYQDISKKFKLAKPNLIFTEKDYVGEKLTLGILIKSNDAYNFFRTYFEDNWLQIQNCKDFRLSSRSSKYKNETPGGYLQGFFYPFFYPSLGFCILILSYGLYRKWYWKHNKSKNEKGEGENLYEIKFSKDEVNL